MHVHLLLMAFYRMKNNLDRLTKGWHSKPGAVALQDGMLVALARLRGISVSGSLYIALSVKTEALIQGRTCTVFLEYLMAGDASDIRADCLLDRANGEVGDWFNDWYDHLVRKGVSFLFSSSGRAPG